jgi:osmotically-inducible protein OsmY
MSTQGYQAMDEKTSRRRNAASSEITDEARLAGEVTLAILSTGRFSSSQLQISVTDGVVTLRGQMASYFQKQAAQVAASAVTGISQLRNEVVVS